LKIFRLLLISMLAMFSLPLVTQAQDLPARFTTIYDAFGKASGLERGWGYSTLIEYGGKRILFDTGGQYKIFAKNVRALNIDLTRLDFVVISHRHGDHTAGLAYVLEQNPSVRIYAPAETGSFGTPVAGSGAVGQALLRKIDAIPADLHYFDGKYADKYPVDSPWPGANITLIVEPLEVVPGVFLFKTVSDEKGTLELNELSMAIKTPKGLAVIVGCSHPGIERILAAASQIDPKLYTVVGGLHLVDKSDPEVTNIVANLEGKWKLERVAPGHCTGEFAQTELERVFKDRHDHPGLGEVVVLPK
jgi:7,8-dihydropterin-6-yl-methyl-4-(beta-D-ribofuranosyl)aminobenzene 5'-phosphate synthase